ncbi:MAG TPA: MarC family protein [Actinobacteria bacterium]|nr:hypothetical protein BMS3Bbin01_00483 [bacterium BMS3Bbin01]HDH26794.1 MarC family protein [Actinomycetota bacterium]HDL50030.1 MarC family protein [Actinomycetota bacterium]
MSELAQAIAALLAITNPVGALPVFLSITEDSDRQTRRRYAALASGVVFAILAVSAIGGRWILEAFGISMPAFQAAGGLVIVLMGLEMLQGSPTRVQHSDRPISEEDSILVPFAMPMVAGPGAITTVITLTAKSGDVEGDLTVVLAVAVIALILFLVLALSASAGRFIRGRGGVLVVRFMGLILVAIGAQYLFDGVKAFFFAS